MAITTDLPTTTKLGISSADIKVANAEEIAQKWLSSFSEAISTGIPDAILSSMTEDAWWRDLLAITWDFRSFQGCDKIKQFLQDRLEFAKLSNFVLTLATVDELYDDLSWIRGHFVFETAVGSGSGVFRIVPVKSQDGQLEWKAHNILTNLESLKGIYEASGSLRNFQPNHGKWLGQRHRQTEFLDKDPEVLVVGGGQSGLEIAARLKLLGVPTLVCERQDRIGDQWRHRYAALCLHDVVCEFILHNFRVVSKVGRTRVRPHAIHPVSVHLFAQRALIHQQPGFQKIGRCTVQLRRYWMLVVPLAQIDSCLLRTC